MMDDSMVADLVDKMASYLVVEKDDLMAGRLAAYLDCY